MSIDGPLPTWPILFCALVVVAAVKGIILAVNGPSFLPDSQLYVEFADAILDHGAAFAPVRWGAEALPPLIFRPPGYPLALAAAKLLSPDQYAIAAIILQCLLNGIAICLIFIVAERLLRSAKAALAAILLYAFSSSILWDNSILSDSLYGSLWNIVVFAVLGHLLGCWRLRLLHSAALGALWGYSLWTRDVGIYFTWVPLILLVAMAVMERRRRWRSLDHVAAFLLPVSASVIALMVLNLYRTGEVFYSLTGAANWLRPVFDIARYGYAEPFRDDGLISTTVRETMRDYGFEAQLRFIAELHQRCRCTPTQLQSIVFDKYLSTIWQYPVAYLRVIVANFNFIALGELLADPVATVNQFFQLGSPLGKSVIPGLSIRNLALLNQRFSSIMLLLMVLSAIAEVISALVFAAYMICIPFLLASAWRRRPMASDLKAVGFLWLIFLSVSIGFSLFHYEARHALPLFPAGIIGIVYVICRLSGAGSREVAVPVPEA